MVGLEPKFDPHEAFLGNDRIHRILRSIWTIDRIDVYEPIDVGTFGFLLKDRINNVRVDVPFAIGNGHVNKIRSFSRHTRIGLESSMSVM